MQVFSRSGVQLNLASQPKQAPTDHIEPDFYIDSDCCTLHDAVQQLAIDSQADTPFIIWLLEHIYQNYTVSQVRQQLEIAKASEIELLQ